jgi:hypothetical protein
MVIDSESQIIYVFGGRVVDGNWEEMKYSGLYSYNIKTSKWKMLQLVSVLFYRTLNNRPFRPAEPNGMGVFVPPRSG